MLRTTMLRATAALSLLVLCACPGPSNPNLEALAGLSCTLTITHDWDRAAGKIPQTPSGDLRDLDFVAATPGASYEVGFAANGASVELGDEPMVGELSEDSLERLRYTLNAGTFGGGRFTVWAENRGYRAELTLYGSGVPITRSERGDLDCRE